MVRAKRFELPRDFSHMDLNHMRLPISPRSQTRTFYHYKFKNASLLNVLYNMTLILIYIPNYYFFSFFYQKKHFRKGSVFYFYWSIKMS